MSTDPGARWPESSIWLIYHASCVIWGQFLPSLFLGTMITCLVGYLENSNSQNSAWHTEIVDEAVPAPFTTILSLWSSSFYIFIRQH